MNNSRHHYRSCSICEAMCGLDIKTEKGETLSIRGDREDSHSKGYVCPKGTAIKKIQGFP